MYGFPQTAISFSLSLPTWQLPSGTTYMYILVGSFITRLSPLRRGKFYHVSDVKGRYDLITQACFLYLSPSTWVHFWLFRPSLKIYVSCLSLKYRHVQQIEETEKPAATGNQTQSSWFEPPVLYSWATTTRQNANPTILHMYTYFKHLGNKTCSILWGEIYRENWKTEPRVELPMLYHWTMTTGRPKPQNSQKWGVGAGIGMDARQGQ